MINKQIEYESSECDLRLYSTAYERVSMETDSQQDEVERIDIEDIISSNDTETTTVAPGMYDIEDTTSPNTPPSPVDASGIAVDTSGSADINWFKWIKCGRCIHPADTPNSGDTKPESSCQDSTEDLRDIKWIGQKWKDRTTFSICLSLALVSGKEEMVALLLDHGADPLICDEKGENCMHHLTRLALMNTSRAVEMYEYLCQELHVEILYKLLHKKTNKGRKPLDLAGNFYIPEMLQVILNTPDVYKFHVADVPMYSFTAYDVSDYEGEDMKCYSSILSRITEFTETEVLAAKECGLLSKEPFKTWCAMKMRAHHNGTLVFIFFWVLFVALYYTKVILYAFSFSFVPMEVALAMLALIYLLTELAHMKSDCREIWRNIRSFVQAKRIPITFTLVYRLFQLFFAVLTLCTSIGYSIMCDNSEVLQGLYVFNSLLSVLSLLFFLQLNTQVGYILIIAAKMMQEVIIFFFTMCVIFVGFALAFYLIHRNPSFSERCPNMMPNATLPDNSSYYREDEMFGSFGESMYETFLMMLTIIPPSDIYFSSSSLPNLVVLMYVLLIIVMTIGMVNLLIAIMAKRLDEIYQWQCELKTLEDLAIILYFEQRMQTGVAKLLGKLSRELLPNYLSQPSNDASSLFQFPRRGRRVYVQVLENHAEK